MRRPPILAALLATAALLGAGGVAPAVAAPAATTASTAQLVVAPRGGGLLPEGKPLVVDVRVTNTGTARLPAGEVAFSMDQAPVASTTELYRGLTTRITVLLGRLTETTARTPAIDPGDSAEVSARIGADDADSILTSADGARLLYGMYSAGDAVKVVAQSSVVRMSSRAPRVGFGTVVPIAAPAGSTGLVDVDAQSDLTGDGGAWTEALAAARAMPAAVVALDPAVLASIRLAGDAAPGSATAFLSDLGDLSNTVVRLPYADGDVTLQRAAGLSGTLSPDSFASASTAAATAATPTAAPTPAATSSPDPEDLTRWSWSDTGFSWPVHGTTTTVDLNALGRDDGVVLLASDDLADSAARVASGPLADVDGTRVLTADDSMSGLLATATTDGVSGRAALASLVGALATDAATRATTGVLAVAGRGADPARLTQVLDLLNGQRWIRSESLAGMLGQSRVASVDLRAGSIPAARVATARTLIEGEHDVRRLSSAVPQPEQLLAPYDLALTGLLSARWRGDDTGWSEAATAATTSFAGTANSVTIQPSDPRTIIGTDGTLKVSVMNALAQSVTVTVAATVDNGRLQFGGPTTLRVPARASASADLGFRSIANGRARVSLALSAPDGASIGVTSPRIVTVQAGFDTIIAVVLLTLLALLLALGVYRNVVRRRRPKADA